VGGGGPPGWGVSGVGHPPHTRHQPPQPAPPPPPPLQVRVYNWAQRRCLVARLMLDDVLCCALHPAGCMLLVGMHDRLRLFNVYAVRGRVQLIS
jgi:hypothetical protein